jgi:hypothetical protein
MKSEIYKIGRSLGLDKKDIDKVLSSNSRQMGNTAGALVADVYKSGTDYGAVSPKDLYKSGDLYGTVAPKDLYKGGNMYGVVAPKDLYKGGNMYGTVAPEDLL